MINNCYVPFMPLRNPVSKLKYAICCEDKKKRTLKLRESGIAGMSNRN